MKSHASTRDNSHLSRRIGAVLQLDFQIRPATARADAWMRRADHDLLALGAAKRVLRRHADSAMKSAAALIRFAAAVR